MSTVYLDRKNLSIDVKGGLLEISPAPRGRGSIPLKLVTRLVMCGRVSFNSSALARLAQHGIAVVCLAGRNHRCAAQMTGITGNDAKRRVHQFMAATKPELRLPIARDLIAAKMRAGLRELMVLESRRPALRRPIKKATRTLLETESCIADAGLDSLIGLEGSAAAAWFRVLTFVFPRSLEFSGRNRRPPRDPANAVLSLSYTLLHAEAVAACAGHGLDPMLGFLHEPAHGRESLACDLIEPLRPRVDARIVELFSRQELTREHFSMNTAGCRLKKTGRHIFYQWWEAQALPFRRYLRRRGHELVRSLEQVTS